jgi:hypothetical protein
LGSDYDEGYSDLDDACSITAEVRIWHVMHVMHVVMLMRPLVGWLCLYNQSMAC